MLSMAPRLSRSSLSLYLVFGPQDLLPDVDPHAFLQAALDGGVSCVQWRDKSPSASAALDERKRQCAPLLALARQAGIPFLFNDDLELAQALEADGLHLGQDDASPILARRKLGDEAIIGWSVGTAEERARFDQIHAQDPNCIDYLGVGPAFVTSTKSDAGESLGAVGISNITRGLSLPTVAIGGINPSNCTKLKSTAIDGIAVVGAIAKQNDPKAAALLLREIWKSTVTI